MSSVQELEELKKRLGISRADKKDEGAKEPDIANNLEDRTGRHDTSKQTYTGIRDEDTLGVGVPLRELIPLSEQIRRKMVMENYIMRFVDFDMIVNSSAGTALYEGQEYSLNDLSGAITEEGENFKASIDMVSPIITPKGKGLLVKVSILANGKKIDETIIGGKNQDEIKAQIKILLERARIKYKQMKG